VQELAQHQPAQHKVHRQGRGCVSQGCVYMLCVYICITTSSDLEDKCVCRILG